MLHKCFRTFSPFYLEDESQNHKSELAIPIDQLDANYLIFNSADQILSLSKHDAISD